MRPALNRRPLPRRRVRAAATSALIAVGGVVMSIPLLYMFAGSLKSAGEARAFPPVLLPATPVWSNFADAWEYLTPQVVLNTFAFAFGTILLQMAIALPAAFALAFMKMRGQRVMLGALIVPMFVPASFTLVPMFVIALQLGMLNTFAGLIVPMAAQCAFAILLFRNFFLTLPKGLIEAALLDGASWLRVLLQVVLPLIKPALATYFSISFLTVWNVYIWALIIAPDPALKVLNVALAPLAGGDIYTVSPSVGLAGAVIAVAPVLAVFIVFQRWYTNGATGTGLD